MVPIAAAKPVPEECPVPAELNKPRFSPTVCTALCARWGYGGCNLVLTIRITEEESSSHNLLWHRPGPGLHMDPAASPSCSGR